MKRNAKNAAKAAGNGNANANVVSKSTTANAQVVDNKSTLAGEQEKIYKILVGNLRKLYKQRSTTNGRLIDLAECAGEYASIVKSGDFKGAVKMNRDNLKVVQTDGKGAIVGTYFIPVRMVALESRKNGYTDYKIEDLVVKYMGRKSAKNWSLAGYTHDGKTVDTAVFSDLRHEFTHDVPRMQSAVGEDGKTYKVAVFEEDENGNRKAVKDVVTETFVPVVCDTISPKDFENAVAKAIESMWLKLFAAKK